MSNDLFCCEDGLFLSEIYGKDEQIRIFLDDFLFTININPVGRIEVV